MINQELDNRFDYLFKYKDGHVDHTITTGISATFINAYGVVYSVHYGLLTEYPYIFQITRCI